MIVIDQLHFYFVLVFRRSYEFGLKNRLFVVVGICVFLYVGFVGLGHGFELLHLVDVLR
jgi:hypothetical protein